MNSSAPWRMRSCSVEPPKSPLLIHYGEGFAAFIDGFAPAASLPYLADVARLEYARGRAYHAADAEPVSRDAFAALAEGEIGNVRVSLHPSVTIISSAYPILSIWQVNQEETPHSSPEWRAEAALVARPYLEVETWRLGPGVDCFLLALRGGATVAEAVAAASAASEEFRASDGLAVLIGANLAVANRRLVSQSLIDEIECCGLLPPLPTGERRIATGRGG